MNADGGPLDKARTMQGGFPEPCSLVMKHFGSQRSPSNYMKISQMIFLLQYHTITLGVTYYLIGGIPTPLKNMKVRLDNHPNYWGK